MSEEDLNSAIQEVAPQVLQEEAQHQQPETHEDEQQKNWQAMRRRQKEMENELRQKNEMVEKLLQAQFANTPKPTPIVEEEDDPEEYVPAGKVKGIAKKAMQPLEQKIHDLEAKLAKQEQDKLFNSLRSKYQDFDDVVNIETLEILEQREPELAETIAGLKDPYKMGMQSYKYIKALGLVDELPNSKRSKELNKKIEQNKKTVASPLSYEKRPIAQAYRSSQVDSKKLYEEMMHYASGAGGSL